MSGRPRFVRRVRPRNLQARADSENQLTKFPRLKGKLPAGETLEDRNDEESASKSEESSGVESGREADETDVDAPHTAQWVDEDEFEEDSDEEQGGAGTSQSKLLRDDLSVLPFGALRKAQSILDCEETSENSEDESSDTSSEDGTSDGNVVAKPRKDIAKRSSKHAPIEVTSKKPVTRRRQVVEVKKIEPRDPRFLSMAGEFKKDKFQTNYGFLAEAHRTELHVLRDNLKRARKLKQNAPQHLKDDYEAETQRLELAVKRVESTVNKERMEGVEREALRKAAKDEKEKRKQGKGSWYLKKADKRELVTHARYEALAAEGGNRAVKRAIEKKQKKISQREKRSRPFPKASGRDEGVRKRRKLG